MACPQAAGSQTREKAVNDISNPSTEQPQGQTRREFIRKVLLTTAYVAPAIVSLSVTGMASAASQGGDSRRGGGSPMSPMSPMMRMMSPMEMETMMSMGNPGNIWK